jgi:hypothetical protein
MFIISNGSKQESRCIDGDGCNKVFWSWNEVNSYGKMPGRAGGYPEAPKSSPEIGGLVGVANQFGSRPPGDHTRLRDLY